MLQINLLSGLLLWISSVLYGMYTKFMFKYKHLGLTRVKGETKKFLIVNNANKNILFQMQSIWYIM